MKLSLVILSAFGFSTVFSQQEDTANIRSINLDEFVVTAGKAKKQTFKSHIDNVHYAVSPLKPNATGGLDTPFYLTSFSTVAEKSITIFKIDCRLKKFDTNELTVLFSYFQVVGSDSTLKFITVNPDNIVNNRIQIRFAASDRLNIKPYPFFLGFAFISKNKKDAIDYRLYSSASSGRNSAILIRSNNHYYMVESDEMPFVFPFTMEYY